MNIVDYKEYYKQQKLIMNENEWKCIYSLFYAWLHFK